MFYHRIIEAKEMRHGRLPTVIEFRSYCTGYTFSTYGDPTVDTPTVDTRQLVPRSYNLIFCALFTNIKPKMDFKITFSNKLVWISNESIYGFDFLHL